MFDPCIAHQIRACAPKSPPVLVTAGFFVDAAEAWFALNRAIVSLVLATQKNDMFADPPIRSTCEVEQTD